MLQLYVGRHSDKMKGFGIFLLCVIAAVQGRSTSVKVVNNQRSLAAAGENPWVVHLRLAVGSSGFLESAVGALIDNSWVLTTAEAIRDQRFIWVRFGAVEVIRPELVIESSTVRIHEDYNNATVLNNIALISLNRFVESTANIAPIGLPAASSNIGTYANYCSYGQTERNGPGEFLSCWDVTQVSINNNAVIVAGENVSASKFDSGAPLVEDGILVGLLAQGDDELAADNALFIRTSPYVEWISGMTGVDFVRRAVVPAEGSLDVIFVN